MDCPLAPKQEGFNMLKWRLWLSSCSLTCALWLAGTNAGLAGGTGSTSPDHGDVHASVTPSTSDPIRANPAGGHDPSADPASASSAAELIWASLIEGNHRFMMDQPLTREPSHRRMELAQGQHPRVVVLGCADSRVSPELVFDQDLGELFVVRTAVNVADPVALGSIEYAVEHLHAEVLVILGHEKCGAVAAASSGERMPTAHLNAIVQKIAPALAPMKGLLSESEMAVMGIRANVRKSARDVLEASSVLKREVESGHLTVIRAVYQLESGEVLRLD
jgi:carbonic anhydrase